VFAVLAWLALIGLTPGPAASESAHHVAQASPPGAKTPATPKLSKKSPAADYTPTVRFQLRTQGITCVGMGGEIEGVVNPTLRVNEGAIVQISLVNGDAIEHDAVFPDFNAATDRVFRKGASSVTVFRADKGGEFPYFCSLPGHKEAGMAGKI